ncbi:MAG TPA: HD domain-containing protein, partial [Syntrophorhabdaceae bacterium]|nr:HD domain-containing protein [Syntrophorhabdaceae bacterium]
MDIEYSLKEKIACLDIIKELKKSPIRGNVYLVGGSIRELFLCSQPNDFDFAITDEKDIKVFEEILNSRAFIIGKKPIHAFRIAKDGKNIDLTKIEKDITDDLLRRDFTINAIAYDLKRDEILDPLNGLVDLKEKIIIHIKKENLIKDPLRMLKAVRHFSTLDGFIIHDNLYTCICELGHLIKNVASERIKYEFDQIVCSRQAFSSLKVMETTGLLFEIFPELIMLKRFDEEKRLKPEVFGHTIDAFKYLYQYGNRYQMDKQSIKITGYALLFHDLGKPQTFSYDREKKVVHFFYHERFSEKTASLIMERMRFSINEMRQVKTLIQNHMRIFLISAGETTQRAIRRVILKMGEFTPLLILMTLCDMYGSSEGKDNASTKKVLCVCEEMLSTFKRFQEKPLPRLITGHDLIEIGYKEGPEIG